MIVIKGFVMSAPFINASALAPCPDYEPCACRSGLTHPKCCGLALEEVDPIEDDARHAERLVALARAQAAGDHEAIHSIAVEVLEVSPGQRSALGALFEVLKDTGRPGPAAIIIDRLASLHPNDAFSRMIAAQFLLTEGDLPGALLHSRMLVRLAPEAMVSHFTLGQTFLVQGNGKAAEHHFRIALELPLPRGPQIPLMEMETGLAHALRAQGKFDAARRIYTRLLAIDGRNLRVLLTWAGLEEAARNFDLANDLLDRAAAIAPNDAHIRAARAALLRRTAKPERALEVLDAGDNSAADEDIGILHQKGQILDSMGRYDEAFAAFESFKCRLRERSGFSYQAERAEKLVTSLRNFFTESRARLLPRAEVRADTPQPIFIIGFPRSGTTLMEQALSSHSNIAAGDELPIIHSMADRLQSLLGSPLSYPQALSELWMGDRVGHIDTLRDLYLNEAARFGAVDPAKRWFTDKMPLNETHLGPISLLFPASPIIHLIRHPLDVVLSVFSNGLNHGFHCAYALESAARHYALIADLIAHYCAVMPFRYHAVRYEELVSRPEDVLRKTFEFIGEPFDARALEFHTNLRPARTASYAQVTEKLYDRSVYRYRNYLRHLEPVIPILQASIERLGYTIDD